MSIARASGGSITTFLCWPWMRKNSSERAIDETGQQLSEALARLAETSPHLLRDIGFGRDPGSSSLTREVWTREGLCIAVVRYDAGAGVHVEGLTP
jgi:hypothetical protein